MAETIRRRGLGASLWAWLNREAAVAYLQRTLAVERVERDKAEAEAKGNARRLAEAEKERNAAHMGRDLAEEQLAAAERELAKLREVHAANLRAYAELTTRFTRVVAEKAELASSADAYLRLAESYADDADALRWLIDDLRDRLVA